jgi:predicted transcriptional regulator
MSDITVADILLREQFWTLRFAVDEKAVNVGGLTLYGAGFGNHDQDILIRVYLGTMT